LWATRSAPVALLAAATSGDIACVGEDGLVRRWSNPVPADPAALAAWLDRATSAIVDAADRVAVH
jgi:hypothetical protein